MLPDISVETIQASTCLRFANQALIENNILIPDTKPSIKKILRINSEISYISARASDGEVILEGAVCETLIYIGENPQLPFYTVKENAEFKESVIIPEITPAMKVFVQPEIEFIEENLLNERKVNVKNVVDFQIFAFAERTCEAAYSAEDPNLQTLTEEISFSAPADIIRETINISENIVLPAGKPDISEILTWDAYICDKDIRALDGRVQIKATLCLEALYTDDYTETAIPEILNATLPVNGYAEAPSSRDGMTVLGEIFPKNVYLRAADDENGDNRLIEADISLCADLLLAENHEESIVRDAYSLTVPVMTQAQTMEYTGIMPTVSSTFTVSDSVSLDDSLPDIVQVLKIWSYVSLDDSVIDEDRVIAEGDVRLEVLYVGTDDSQPLQIFNVSLPFRHEIEITDAHPSQVAYVTSTTENTGFTVLNDRELEFTVSPVLDITLMENGTVDFLTNIEGTSEDLANPSLSSAVIYVVQPGDTLWDIAKRFGTTVENLESINNLEDPGLIYAGDRLLIMRTVMFK